MELCPRGIVGEGFGRMHHLVAQLKSNKHGMDAKEAAYMARQHNFPKSKVAGNGGLGAEEALSVLTGIEQDGMGWDET